MVWCTACQLSFEKLQSNLHSKARVVGFSLLLQLLEVITHLAFLSFSHYIFLPFPNPTIWVITKVSLHVSRTAVSPTHIFHPRAVSTLAHSLHLQDQCTHTHPHTLASLACPSHVAVQLRGNRWWFACQLLPPLPRGAQVLPSTGKWVHRFVLCTAFVGPQTCSF